MRLGPEFQAALPPFQGRPPGLGERLVSARCSLPGLSWHVRADPAVAVALLGC